MTGPIEAFSRLSVLGRFRPHTTRNPIRPSSLWIFPLAGALISGGPVWLIGVGFDLSNNQALGAGLLLLSTVLLGSSLSFFESGWRSKIHAGFLLAIQARGLYLFLGQRPGQVLGMACGIAATASLSGALAGALKGELKGPDLRWLGLAILVALGLGSLSLGPGQALILLGIAWLVCLNPWGPGPKTRAVRAWTESLSWLGAGAGLIS